MKDEALEVLRNRRAIRSFKPEQITDEELDAVIEAGLYAPTGAGTQKPIIVVVQDPETVARLDALNKKMMNIDMDVHPYYGAPTVLLVLTSPDDIVPETDCALVGGNMLNAAYAAGLGTCWIHRCTDMFDSPEGKELLKEWGLPEDLRGYCSIALGYPNCPQPEAAPRREGRVVRI